VICLCLDFRVDSPSLGIDLVERPVIEVLELKVKKTHDYESKKKFQVGESMVGVAKRTISFYIHWTPSLKHIVEIY
jgi:hypothetical protein